MLESTTPETFEIQINKNPMQFVQFWAENKNIQTNFVGFNSPRSYQCMPNWEIGGLLLQEQACEPENSQITVNINSLIFREQG